MAENVGSIYYTVDADTSGLLKAERDVDRWLNRVESGMKGTEQASGKAERALSKTGAAARKTGIESGKTAQSTSRLSGSLDDVNTSARRADRSIDSTTSALSRQRPITKSVRQETERLNRENSALGKSSGVAANAVNAVIGALSVREVIRYADAWQSAENQLKQVTSSAAELADVQTKLVSVARDTRSNFEATNNLYARLARSTTELGLSQSELIGLTTTINQSFAVSGATAEEASAAITQLSQGLASGALRGDEFNSVAEQAPDIMRAIASSLDLTIGELRDFAATGGITAEIVVNALQGASDEIGGRFANSVATFGQKIEVARTNLIAWVGSSEEVKGAVAALGNAIVTLSEHMDAIVVIGKAVAALYAGRLVGSMVAATSAMRATTTAAGVLRGAMAALGGPIGLLIGAGGLLYTFREQLGLSSDDMSELERITKDTDAAIEGLGGAVDSSSEAALDANYQELTSQLFEVGRAAAAARVQLAELEAQQSRQTEQTNSRGRRAIGPNGPEQATLDAINVQKAREELEKYEALEDRLQSKLTENDAAREEAARRRAERQRVRREGIKGETDDTDDNTGSTNTNTRSKLENADATDEAAQASKEFSDSLQSLEDRLFPAEAAARQYKEEQILLTTALAKGEIGVVRYLNALSRLKEAQESGSETPEMTPSEAYGEGGGFGAQIGTGDVQDDPFTEWLNQANQAFKSFDQLQADTAQSFQTEFGRAFESVLMGTKDADDAFKDMGRSILSNVVTAIGEMIAQLLVYKAITATLGFFGGGAVSGIASGFAGMFDKGGYIRAGQFGIAGENGPEFINGPANITSTADTAQIMARSASEYMPSNRASQSSQQSTRPANVTVNVNNAPPGTQVRERTMGSKQVIDVLIADMGQNGRASQFMQSTFNLSRRPK